VCSYPPGVELEERRCPSGCAADDELVLEGRDRIHGIPGRFRVVRCRSCGLMRTDPRPSAATIGVYYPDHYQPYASTGEQVVVSRSAIKRTLRRWLGLEPRRLPAVAPGRAVEIGCASGSYLQQMRRDGWAVEGIEFSESAASQARAQGLQVATGSVETASPGMQPVDLVAAWMVLEHLHEPVAALRRIRSWVRPDGYLVGSVPVHGRLFLRLFGGASYDLHLPNHLYHFTRSSLTNLLRLAGWRVERIVWQRNPNTLLWTLEYVATDRGWNRLAALVRWLRAAPAAARLRMLLGWIQGVTRTSGRIEFSARPLPEPDGQRK
jgi:SAM-dependent methyltransferase